MRSFILAIAVSYLLILACSSSRVYYSDADRKNRRYELEDFRYALYVGAPNQAKDILYSNTEFAIQIDSAFGMKTPLHYALIYSNVGSDWERIDFIKSVIHTLIEYGADVNARDSKGYSPLHYAGNLYFDSEKDYTSLNRGTSQMYYKYKSNKKHVEEALVLVDPQNQRSEVHDEYLVNVGLILEKLLSSGADINLRAVENDGITPLFAAIINGKDDLAHFLIQNGADVNMKCNVKGIEYTPLQYAESLGRNNLAIKLREAKAE